MPLTPEQQRAFVERQRAPVQQQATASDRFRPNFGQFADAEPGMPLVTADAETDGGGGGFLGGLADLGRAVVPRGVRDVAGSAIQTALSGERTLNLVGGFAGNDDLGTDIADQLEEVPVVGRGLRIGFDVAAAPATVLTAGFGGGIASGLARGGFAGRAAGAVVAPVTRGNAAQRFAAETILGTGAGIAGETANELLPDSGASTAISLAAGALGGTTALRVIGGRAPGLVGRQVVINERTAVPRETFERLTQPARTAELIPNRSVDDVLEDAGVRVELDGKYAEGQQPGLLQRVAQSVNPKDPAAAALLGENARRQAAHQSLVAARMAKAEAAMRAFDLDEQSRVLNVERVGDTYRLTPEQQEAVGVFADILDESLEFEKLAGVEVAEITGQSLEALQRTPAIDNPTLGDLIERLGAGEGHYFPRRVVEVGGIETTRRALDPSRARARSPGFGEVPEHIATMEENLARGVRYDGNPLQALHDRLTASGRRANAKWMAEASERFARTPGQYMDDVAPGLRPKAVTLRRQLNGRLQTLTRRISRRTAQTSAARRARLQTLRAQAAGRRLSAVERTELRTLERTNALRTQALERSGRAGGRIATGTEQRATTAILRDTDDGLEHLADARAELDDLVRLSDEAGEAKVLTDTEIAETRTEIEQIRGELNQVQDGLRLHRDRAIHPLAGEAAVPRLGGARFFPEEFADTMNRSLDPTDRTGALGQLQGFNNVSRAFMATLDLSAVGIQGLLALGTNPVMAGRAIWTAINSLWDPTVYHGFVKQHEGSIDQMIRLGGHWASADDMGEFLFSPRVSRAAERVPGLATLIKGSNLAFSRTGNTLRTQMFESALETSAFKARLQGSGQLARSVSEVEQRKIVSLINSATGFHARQPSSWEQLALFAPRYFTSQLDVIQRGLLRGGADADLARQMLFRTAALGTALTVAANEMRGQQTEFNPIRQNADGELQFNSNFLRIKNIGGADVSLFSGWDSLLGLITTTATAGPIEGLSRTLRTKASPASSLVWDVAQGETFTGEQVDLTTLDGFMEASIEFGIGRLPFTAQDVVREIQSGQLSPTTAVKASFNIFGIKASPTTLFEEQDQLAVELFDRHWTELTGSEKEQVEQARPALFEQINRQDQERAASGDARAQARLRRDSIDDDRISQETALVGILQQEQITLKQFDEEMSKLQAVAAARKEEVDRTLGLTFADSDDPNVQALNGWYELRDQAQFPGTALLNFELWETLEHSFLQTLNDEQRRFIDERSRPKHAPEVAFYFEAKDVVSQSGYYDTTDAAFALLRETLPPEIGGYSQLLAAIDAARLRGDQAVQGELTAVRRAIDETAGAQKKLLRQANPELDAALFRLGRVTRPVDPEFGGFGS